MRSCALANIRVFQANLMDVAEDLGTFDYIIAHGVYAWVPEPVRDRLLAFCRERLAPNGIAFISYNALPGGHLRNLVRDILLQPATAGTDPLTGMDEAMQFLRFIIESRAAGDPFRALLEQEAKQIQRKNPQVLFHDELASFYHPVSVTAFTGHAAAAWLAISKRLHAPTTQRPWLQPASGGPGQGHG